jgi:hypothetical protein
MWRLKRKSEQPGNQATATIEQPPAPDEEFDGTLEQLLAEIDRLAAANWDARDLDTKRRLIRLRHLAGIRLVDEARDGAEFAAPDSERLPAGDPLPEIPAAELTPGLIRAGILRDGCLLVRGLVDPDRALALAEGIDLAFEQRGRADAGRKV